MDEYSSVLVYRKEFEEWKRKVWEMETKIKSENENLIKNVLKRLMN